MTQPKQCPISKLAIIEKDEWQNLKISVWQDTFVGEDSLNRVISDLRRILDDDTTTPGYIETIRNVGYDGGRD